MILNVAMAQLCMTALILLTGSVQGNAVVTSASSSAVIL